jgi:hypothetical protein
MCVIKLLSIKIQELSIKTKDSKKKEFLAWIENELIVKCINTTTQTYVESLKASDTFDMQAQKDAMDKTVTSVLSLLTESNSKMLSEYVGDVSTWITTCIENYIKESKSKEI